MRTGILGGSFNPPHRGHLALALTVLDEDLVDRVVLVPAAVPPHKRAPREADAATRLEMARLLAGEDRRLGVDGLELERRGPSFTIDTIHALVQAAPESSFRLIIGSDLAKTFATWRAYRELLRLAPPLVAERPDDPFRDTPLSERYPGMAPDEVRVMESGRFDMAPVDMSSTVIRRRLADGAGDAEMLRYLTGPVLGFIRGRRLYS